MFHVKFVSRKYVWCMLTRGQVFNYPIMLIALKPVTAIADGPGRIIFHHMKHPLFNDFSRTNCSGWVASLCDIQASDTKCISPFWSDTPLKLVSVKSDEPKIKCPSSKIQPLGLHIHSHVLFWLPLYSYRRLFQVPSLAYIK